MGNGKNGKRKTKSGSVPAGPPLASEGLAAGDTPTAKEQPKGGGIEGNPEHLSPAQEMRDDLKALEDNFTKEADLARLARNENKAALDRIEAVLAGKEPLKATPAQGRKWLPPWATKWLPPWATKWVPAWATNGFFVAAVIIAIGGAINKSYVQAYYTGVWATFTTNLVDNIVLLILAILPEGRVRVIFHYANDTGV